LSREVLETEDFGDYRRVRYRWHVGDTTGVDFTRQRIEPVPRTILEDRWYGLMHEGNNASELQERLDGILWDLGAAFNPS